MTGRPLAALGIATLIVAGGLATLAARSCGVAGLDGDRERTTERELPPVTTVAPLERLDRPGETVVVTVLDRDGVPIESARIRHGLLLDALHGEARTEGAGTFHFEPAFAEETVEIAAEGFLTAWRRVAPGDAVGVRLDRAGVIAGTVTMADGESPADVEARLSSLHRGDTARVDGDGHFRFAAIEAGRYRVFAHSADRQRRGHVDVDLGAGETVEVSIAIPSVERLHEVRGRLVDRSSRPVGGARVVAGFWDPVETTTDADGAFVLRVGDDGRWVRTFARGFAMRELHVGLSHGPVESLGDVVLDPGAVVVGRVVGADGEPIGGAVVGSAGAPTPQDRRWDVRTEPDGTFELVGLPLETERRFEVTHPGTRGASFAASTDGRSVMRLPDVVLGLAGRLVGRIVDEDGAPISGVRLGLRSLAEERARPPIPRGVDPKSVPTPAGAPPRIPGTMTDRQGRYELTAAPAGRVELRIRSRAHRVPAPVVLDIVAGTTTEAPLLRLETGAVLRGRLVATATGEPIPSVVLLARSRRGTPPSNGYAVTGADGTFAMAALHARGHYSIVVRWPHGGSEELGDVGIDGREIELTTTPRGRIAGRVLAGARPWPRGAFTVHAVRDGRGASIDVRDAAGGGFERDGLAPGWWSVFAVSASGGVSPAVEADVRAGMTTDVGTLAIDVEGKVTGEVRLASGRPAPLATVTASREAHGVAIRRTARAGLDGRFVLRGLATGPWSVRATTDDNAESEPIVVQVTGGGVDVALVVSAR